MKQELYAVREAVKMLHVRYPRFRTKQQLYYQVRNERLVPDLVVGGVMLFSKRTLDDFEWVLEHAASNKRVPELTDDDLTLAEVAEQLGCQLARLYHLIYTGRLPMRKVGNQYAYSKHGLAEIGRIVKGE